MCERKLLEKETQTRHIQSDQNSTSPGLLSIDKDGIITEMSNTTRALLFFPEQSGIGEKLEYYIDESHKTIYLNRLDRYFKGEELPPQCYHMNTSKGQSIWVESLVIPSGNDKRRKKKLSTLFRKIYNNSQTKDRYNNSENELLSPEVDLKMLSMISHELKSPLTAIYSSVQLLKKYGRSWGVELYNEKTEKVEENLRRLINNLESILLVSQIEKQISFLPSVKTDLRDIIDSIIEELNPQLQEYQKIIVEISLQDGTLCINELLARHIIRNLLSNAVKFSPDGNNIFCRITSNNTSLEITVKDKGIGVSDEDKKRIFNTFFRGQNTSGIEGAGLGLAIIKKILNMIGGEIECYSKPGKGTLFRVILPL